MRHLDLFSGIGGFALAAKHAGWETVGFCEVNPFCQKVLAKHFPNKPIFNDVTTLCKRISDCPCVGTDQFTDTYGHVDVITAGVPCQPASQIGKQRGTSDERWLWPDAIRIVRELQPKYAIFENPYGILTVNGGEGFKEILEGLDHSGFDAWWDVIPACAVGATHQRKRVWVVAHSRGEGLEGHAGNGNEETGRAEQTGPTSEGGLPQDEHFQGWWDADPGVQRVANGVPARVDRLTAVGNAIVPQVAYQIFKAINTIDAE